MPPFERDYRPLWPNAVRYVTAQQTDTGDLRVTTLVGFDQHHRAVWTTSTSTPAHA